MYLQLIANVPNLKIPISSIYQMVMKLMNKDTLKYPLQIGRHFEAANASVQNKYLFFHVCSAPVPVTFDSLRRSSNVNMLRMLGSLSNVWLSVRRVPWFTGGV